jgi:hypothetical protein
MLASRVVTGLLFCTAALLGGCSAPLDEEAEATPEALGQRRTGPTKTVSTTQPVRRLQGYNAFRDSATSADCVEPKVQPEAGEVTSSFYLKHVETREELAKELGVDLAATLSVPAGSGNAAIGFMKSFKQNASTASFLVRAVRSYTVTNRAELSLSSFALELVEQGDHEQFLQKCGGSYIKSVRYETQVLGLMQYEAQSAVSAAEIVTNISGGVNKAVEVVGDAKGELKAKASRLEEQHGATMSLRVEASGFLPSTSSEGATSDTFEKIDALRAEMNAAFERDLREDARDYFRHRDAPVAAGAPDRELRRSRSVSVTQGPYNELANAPRDRLFARVTETLQRAEEFVREIEPLELRMTWAQQDEISSFLQSQQTYAFNRTVDPLSETSGLVALGQEWDVKFGSDPTRSLIGPLRNAVERCRTAAGNGNYGACTGDRALTGHLTRAEAALEEYARAARIVRLSARMPRDRTFYHRNADNECASVSMRLPRRSEAIYVAPMVTALAGPEGVWLAGDAQCKKPFLKMNEGVSTVGCADGVVPNPLDWRKVVCVGRSGPVPALRAP